MQPDVPPNRMPSTVRSDLAASLIHAVAKQNYSGADAPQDIKIERVQGGLSGDAVYRASTPALDTCVKLYRNADVASHDWTILTRQERQGARCVPRPLHRIDNVDLQAIATSWMSGMPLGNVALSHDQARRIADALREFGAAPTAGLPLASNHPNTGVDSVRRRWQAVEQLHPALHAELRQDITDWLAGREADELKTPTMLWLGRGDPNLANVLDDGERITFVDFEHTGINDQAVELADMAEHLQSHQCQEAVWETMWEAMQLDDAALRRLKSARRLSAIFWFVLLLSDETAKRLNPPERVFDQARRIELLLGQ